jgi:peptidyl-prolyl cis-trans isomerase D
MLGPIRKFSTSIYAKILLVIIIIPFVFWGMGSSLTGGNKNIIVVIDKDKYSIQEFTRFIQRTANQKIVANQIDDLLSVFIGEKIIEKQIEFHGIQISNKALSNLLKHQKDFKREDKFSRIEYEKFLLKNNLTAVTFETLLSKQEKKKQLFNFIGGGLIPTDFLIDSTYNSIYQKRSIEFIDLNNIFKNKLNFSDQEISKHYIENKNKFTEIYKSVKILELTPKELSEENDFSDLFFKRIDEIDDLIINGSNLTNIVTQFNLTNPKTSVINNLGNEINSGENKVKKLLVDKIFNINDLEPISLVENLNKYYLIEVVKTEEIQKKEDNELVKMEIIQELSKQKKRSLISKLISDINKNNYDKSKFNDLSKNENVVIKKVDLENANDEKSFKKDILMQIYSIPEKKFLVANNFDLTDSFLIYIDNVSNASIDKNNKNYEEYLNLTKSIMVNNLFNTYDEYIKKKHEIEINYQALDTVKSYFN